MASVSALGEFGVLDDIGRAREHGDLTGAFRSVGEAIEAATAKLGLERFGEPGDVFDLTVHEALMHEYSDEVTEPTCTRVLIPAIGSVTGLSGRPAVAEPTEALPNPAEADEPAAGDTDD